MPDAFTLRPPGDGPKFWLVGDHLTFKVTSDHTRGTAAVAENYILPGGGPPPHVHHREHETFYVLDGRMQFCLGDTTCERGPGAALFLPRGVPHCFKNVGDAPARFLLLATPGGFEAFTAECGEPITAIPHPKPLGPADIERLLARCAAHGLTVLPPGTHAFPNAAPPAPADRRVWALGHKITFKLTGDQTQGALSMVEVESPVGPVVPPHAHRAMDEFFYVLSGAYRFTVDGQQILAPAGTFLHVPPGVFHSFTADPSTPAPARLLDIHTPGHFDRFFTDCGLPAGDEPTPPPDLPDPPIETLLALLDRHGMDIPTPTANA